MDSVLAPQALTFGIGESVRQLPALFSAGRLIFAGSLPNSTDRQRRAGLRAN